MAAGGLFLTRAGFSAKSGTGRFQNMCKAGAAVEPLLGEFSINLPGRLLP